MANNLLPSSTSSPETLLENLDTTIMAKIQKQTIFRWQAYKPLLAAAFAVAGVFNMVGAVVAAGTTAGTAITNTATATYNDGNGNNVNAVSNTVTINVAEIAGLTVSSSGFNDDNRGSIVGGDTLTYDFLVTNTGNASTYVFVPGASNIDVTNGTITSVDIINASGASIGSIPVGGITTQGLGTVPNGGLIPADASFTVRVTVTAATLANSVGQSVGVQFGNTLDNTTAPANSTQNQQNIPNTTDAASNPNDLRTLNEGALTPVNGEREAAASRSEAYNTAPITLAQALLLKTSAYSNSTTPADPADDTIVYNLELRLGNQSFPSVDSGRLEGTNINLDTGGGSNVVSRILVSDAVPANTDFDPAFAPTAPSGWTAVYSITPLTTTAQQAAWTTAKPATAADITRVGFIYNSGTSGSLAPLTTVTGFSFRVITNGLVAPGGSIANIAQVFGETEGDAGNNLVYDESGDQRPNNFDDGFTPTSKTTTFNPATDFGVGNIADPENTPNANDGTGPKGESNVVNVSSVPNNPGNLFNGPNGVPNATGPTNINDDFTNVSATILPVQLGAQGVASNPNVVTITNQVQNPVGAPTRLDTVTLLPLTPTEATAAAGAGVFGNVLPDLTIVTIKFGAQTAAYQVQSGTFQGVGGAGTPLPSPVVIGTLLSGQVQSYTVDIDLPAGTPQIAGYGVPIAAFVDNDGNGLFTPATETVSNITIDRAYTGFMDLVKSARVVYAQRDGVTLPPSAFSSNPATLNSFNLRPGDALEYQVAYTNISEPAPAGGGGNVILNANNFVLTENGTTGGNNWATITTHLQNTGATSGTVSYQDLTGPTVNADPANGTKVDVYVNTVGTVAPAGTGSLTFRRQVK